MLKIFNNAASNLQVWAMVLVGIFDIAGVGTALSSISQSYSNGNYVWGTLSGVLTFAILFFIGRLIGMALYSIGEISETLSMIREKMETLPEDICSSEQDDGDDDTAVLPAEANRCIDVQSLEQLVDNRYCTNCGSTIYAEDNFCAKCGRAIRIEAIDINLDDHNLSKFQKNMIKEYQSQLKNGVLSPKKYNEKVTGILNEK